MELVAHRGLWSWDVQPNSLGAITTALRAGLGIETDLRAHGGQIYLSHDPIESPRNLVELSTLLELATRHPNQLLFLNVKEDGILPYLAKHRTLVDRLRVVFFDMSVPQLVQYSRALPAHQLATRVSEYESHPSLVDHCGWIWVDAFEKDWDADGLRYLIQHHKRRLAIVSPELHHRDPARLWRTLRENLTLFADGAALCTDQPVIFQQELAR